MIKNNYDVIIIGAGPSGSVLGYDLAKTGLNILVLEKEILPRYKPCGGGLTTKAAELIGFDVSDAYELPMSKGVLSYKNSNHVNFQSEESMGWMIMRDKFDYLVVQRAVAAGVELRDGIRVEKIDTTTEKDFVTVVANGDKYRAKILVGADGVNSIVAKSVGLRDTLLGLKPRSFLR